MPTMTERARLAVLNLSLGAQASAASEASGQLAEYALTPRTDKAWGPADFDSANGARAWVMDLGALYNFDSIFCVGLKVAGTVPVDTYAVGNQDAVQQLGNGTTTGAGQEFDGEARLLKSCQFYLAKVGTPTGNATAYLYASDEASPAIPTGPALATSGTVDVSTLTASLTLTTFTFTRGWRMAASTKYFIVIRYSGGDVSNYVTVGVDTSTPSHAGNFATEAASAWTGAAGTDGVFLVTGLLEPADITWQVRTADDDAFTVNATDWGSKAYVLEGAGAAAPRAGVPQPNKGPTGAELLTIMAQSRLHGHHLRAAVTNRFVEVSFTNTAGSSTDNTLLVPAIFASYSLLSVQPIRADREKVARANGETLARWTLEWDNFDAAELWAKIEPRLGVGDRVFWAFDATDRPERFLGLGGAGNACMGRITGHSFGQGATSVINAQSTADEYRQTVRLVITEVFNSEEV